MIFNHTTALSNAQPKLPNYVLTLCVKSGRSVENHKSIPADEHWLVALFSLAVSSNVEEM